MAVRERVTQSRSIAHFERVILHAYNVENEVVIRQGDHESLTIEGPADVLDRIETGVQGDELHIRMGGGWAEQIKAALSTSLTRPHVTYTLTVKTLRGLDIAGLARVQVGGVKTDRLAVKFRGVGDFNIAGLTAERLDVDMPPGPCRLEAAGRVDEQHVSLSGMGEYSAGRLESRTAHLTLKGPGGHAVVRVADELNVAINGPGRVEYYGDPRVNKRISPLAQVRHLGER